MFLKGYTGAMLTNYVKKITITYPPTIRHLFGAIIIVSTEKSCSINQLKKNCWKVQQSSASHLKSSVNKAQLSLSRN